MALIFVSPPQDGCKQQINKRLRGIDLHKASKYCESPNIVT